MRREVIAQIEEQPIDMGGNAEVQKKAYASKENNTGNKRFIEAEKIDAANVANHRAEAFYEEHGVKHAAAAFELLTEHALAQRLTARHMPTLHL